MSSQLNVPATPPPRSAEAGSQLPDEYGVTRLVLMPRDPDWLHAYWEVAPYTWTEVGKLFGSVADGRAVLRFFLGDNGGTRGFDVDVRLEAHDWYVNLASRPGRCRAELGLVLPGGRFVLLAVSNEVWLPSGRVSDQQDEKWVGLKTEWERLYALSGGGRVAVGSLDTARAMTQRWDFLGGGSSSSPRGPLGPHGGEKP